MNKVPGDLTVHRYKKKKYYSIAGSEIRKRKDEFS